MADAHPQTQVICVTGGSGFIGSWIVSLLLRRGYTVHATVQNLEDEKQTKHLEAMEGAESGLRLFQMDLLHYESIVAAVDGAAGVIHVASPCFVEPSRDPEKELLDPACKGTINVLTAAKELGVQRVVITSSISAMAPSLARLADATRDENCWADEEYCITKELWYPLSKTKAEKAAWKFAVENGLDIAVVNPGTVLGPMIPPVVNASMRLLLLLLQGKYVPLALFMGFVHVEDVALAHILVYENRSATGRHLCVESASNFNDFANKMGELYPEYSLPRISEDCLPKLPPIKDASKKLVELGLEFMSLDQIVKDSVECFKSKGYLS